MQVSMYLAQSTLGNFPDELEIHRTEKDGDW